ncbi:MAG: alpha/beta hydrolase [Alphaproteobacteria bacterium]|nr:alpha/beta hydrolase [Alphaproteobacteria bacterium]
MFQYWNDGAPISRVFSYHFGMYMSESTHGAGDYNELLRAARYVRTGNLEDWHQAFWDLAERIAGIARRADQAGHGATASETYLRAFTYYRIAELRLAPDDPRKLATYQKAMECWRRGMALSVYPHESVDLPYEGHKLQAWFFPPTGGPRRAKPPCVVFLAGADVLPESNFFRGARHLTARGMACLVFNGPGQGSTIRLLGLPSIPEYERPVTAAVDYLMTRSDIDHGRLGLMGVSMAGYYAPRAACFEPRFKALVVSSALYDVLEELYITHPPLQKHLQWIVGAKSDAEAREKYRPFTLKGLLGRIRCPVLVTHGEKDHMVPLASAQRTYDELTVGDRTLRIFNEDEGGAEHASVDNYVQLLPLQADWMYDRLTTA